MSTPSARIIADAGRETEVVDALGRKLALRRLNALDRLRVFKAAGTALAGNAGWMGMATLAFSVSAIDGVPVPQPGNESQVEALVARLDDAGLDAVARTVSVTPLAATEAPGTLAKN